MNERPDRISDTEAQKQEEPASPSVSLADREKVLAKHRHWLDTNKQDGKQGDFADANLRSADFSRKNLREFYFRGCDLQGADLQEANLQEAYLARANLKGANLYGANLQEALLIRANLQRVDLQGANLQRAILNRANMEGAYLFRANFQKAELNCTDLQRANLSGSDLRGANLFTANLQGALLKGSCLQEADLQEANFCGANLNGANLERAYLKRATFGPPKEFGEGQPEGLAAANLTDARFQYSDLSDANLTGVTSLQSDQLAGAKLLNAKLPKDIARFEGLDEVEKISIHARNIFLAVIAGCVYSWLTIATTTDAALLSNFASTPLPIIQTRVPIAGFYLAGPAILLIIYFYLQIYLQRMWEGLAGLPAIFPDGRTVDRWAYPWLLTGFVRAHSPLLRFGRPAFFWFQFALSVFAAWCLVPLTLAIFWWRYLPRHEWWGTTLLAILLVAGTGAGIVFYWRARNTLRGTKVKSHSAWEGLAVILGFLLAVAITVVISKDAIDNPRYSNADLFEADVSERPVDWKGEKDDPGLVKGARLKDMDLRYADGFGAFMVGADLRGANLRKARFGAAKLTKANMAFANLEGVFLVEANLEEANLLDANLQGADVRDAYLKNVTLREAILQKALLGGADLERADLSDATLEGADLVGANLKRTNLDNTKLRGAILAGRTLRRSTIWLRADLRGARNITCSKLTTAKKWEMAYRDPALACGAPIPEPPKAGAIRGQERDIRTSE